MSQGQKENPNDPIMRSTEVVVLGVHVHLQCTIELKDPLRSLGSYLVWNANFDGPIKRGTWRKLMVQVCRFQYVAWTSVVGVDFAFDEFAFSPAYGIYVLGARIFPFLFRRTSVLYCSTRILALRLCGVRWLQYNCTIGHKIQATANNGSKPRCEQWINCLGSRSEVIKLQSVVLSKNHRTFVETNQHKVKQQERHNATNLAHLHWPWPTISSWCSMLVRRQSRLRFSKEKNTSWKCWASG